MTRRRPRKRRVFLDLDGLDLDGLKVDMDFDALKFDTDGIKEDTRELSVDLQKMRDRLLKAEITSKVKIKSERPTRPPPPPKPRNRFDGRTSVKHDRDYRAEFKSSAEHDLDYRSMLNSNPDFWIVPTKERIFWTESWYGEEKGQAEISLNTRVRVAERTAIGKLFFSKFPKYQVYFDNIEIRMVMLDLIMKNYFNRGELDEYLPYWTDVDKHIFRKIHRGLVALELCEPWHTEMIALFDKDTPSP